MQPGHQRVQANTAPGAASNHRPRVTTVLVDEGHTRRISRISQSQRTSTRRMSTPSIIAKISNFQRTLIHPILQRRRIRSTCQGILKTQRVEARDREVHCTRVLFRTLLLCSGIGLPRQRGLKANWDQGLIIGPPRQRGLRHQCSALEMGRVESTPMTPAYEEEHGAS